MAFDVSLRDPGTGFDIALVPTVTGDTPTPVYFPTVGYPAPLVDTDDDDALLLTLLLT